MRGTEAAIDTSAHSTLEFVSPMEREVEVGGNLHYPGEERHRVDCMST